MNNSTQELKKIARFVSHEGSHPDEIAVALVLLKEKDEVAKKLGLDVSGAEFVELPLSGNFDAHVVASDLPIGQLHGWTDDKDETGKRLAGTCSAIRAAEKVGIRSKPELQGFLAAILDSDTGKHKLPDELGRVSKLVKDANVAEPMVALQWMTKGLKAVLDFEYLREACRRWGTPLQNRDCVDPTTYLQEVMAMPGVISSSVLDYMKRSFEPDPSRKDHCLTLSQISRAMSYTGISDKAAKEWLYEGLTAVASEQEQYIEARKELERAKALPILEPGGEKISAFALAVKTDNRRLGDAAYSYCKPAIKVVINEYTPTGSIAIMPIGPQRPDMRHVLAILRLMSIPGEKRHGANFEQFAREGTCPADSGWYSMGQTDQKGVLKQGAILYGTLNMKPARPCPLNWDLIIKVVQDMHGDKLRNRFDEIAGVEKSAIEPRPQSTEEVQIIDPRTLNNLGDIFDKALPVKAPDQINGNGTH